MMLTGKKPFTKLETSVMDNLYLCDGAQGQRPLMGLPLQWLQQQGLLHAIVVNESFHLSVPYVH